MADGDTIGERRRLARLGNPRNANEVFHELYGTNVSARAMIRAFSSIGRYFMFRAAAICLKHNGSFARFDLPAISHQGTWAPPPPISETDAAELETLYQALANETQDRKRTIVDVAHRRTRGTEWAILYSCTMRPPESGAPKRTTGDIKIVLFNERHANGCIYERHVSNRIFTRSAVEDHDLVAVYAAYFDQMLRDLSFVPMPLILAEWNKALINRPQASEGDARHRAGLPWGLLAPPETPTITLSLDLRKSTFAMQQTRDRRAYAHWLEGVTELSRRITLARGGIFDKFTGDGVICHFVYPSDGEGAEDSAVRSALLCAAELVQAIQLHIGHVLPMLKFRSRAFGPAVGMAIDMATWSLDRDGKPVVVGPGIVNACRLNGGKAGEIILTNDLKERIDAVVPKLDFVEHDLRATHKEFAAELKATCWSLAAGGVRLDRPVPEIQAEVDQVWAEIRR